MMPGATAIQYGLRCCASFKRAVRVSSMLERRRRGMGLCSSFGVPAVSRRWVCKRMNAYIAHMEEFRSLKGLAGCRWKRMEARGRPTTPTRARRGITDLFGGQIQVMFTTVASAASLIEGGQLRALAVTSAERSPAFPQLPTVAEAGVPGYDLESWYGLYAPTKTPPDIIDRLNRSAAKAVQSNASKSSVSMKALSWWRSRPRCSTATSAARRSVGAR